LVSCSNDKTLIIWNVETGLSAGRPLAGHEKLVKIAYFSVDGKKAISSSTDKTIRIWNLTAYEVKENS
jgi:WD40 repeat protein